MTVSSDGSKPRRKFLFVYLPVPKRRSVIVSIAEPAVVQDKTLDTEIGRFINKLDNRGFVDTEVTRFPGVELDRTDLI